MPGFDAIVSGRVQGVGFRYFVQRTAQQLQLEGYARNLPDGTVEVAAQGDRKALDNLVAELNRGPGFSRVENVLTTWLDQDRGFRGFTIRY